MRTAFFSNSARPGRITGWASRNDNPTANKDIAEIKAGGSVCANPIFVVVASRPMLEVKATAASAAVGQYRILDTKELAVVTNSRYIRRSLSGTKERSRSC